LGSATNEKTAMLHVTNGDSAANGLRAAGVPGEVLPWRDVLHEGPVPAGLSLAELRPVRARFIGEEGWEGYEKALADFARRDAALEDFGRHEEVVLWFEHDLYDQLQLLQLLDFFAGRDLGGTRLSLIGVGEYLAPAGPKRLRELFPERREVSAEQLRLGRAAWDAFRAPDPTAIEELLAGDTSPLPFLAAALRRHLEQFPSTKNGLSRSEEQALTAIDGLSCDLEEAFLGSQSREEPRFLGDSTFASYLEDLSRGATPLVLFAEGGPIALPRDPGEARRRFWRRRAVLTEAGREVLDGRRDRVRTQGIDRWLGGVHLQGHEAAWRWDPEARRLVAAAG
jgi:uncharacterized protein DUF1835